MPVINVETRAVHVQELNKGAAETVLLVHGMFSNLSVYYFNIAPILAKHFHVVMYDLKSHGMSEKIADGYDLNSMTDDLSALLDQLELSSVHLAGYSFGGLISLKMAARFPDKVKKLAVIEAPDPNDDKTRDIIDEYSREFLENGETADGEEPPHVRIPVP
jgi:esterase